MVDPSNARRFFHHHPEGRAIMVSLLVGILIVITKIGAFAYSQSVSILADMLESLVHNVAVAFAAYCVWFSQFPADETHLYGHRKSRFLSSAVEGSLVFLAGLLILINATLALTSDHELADVGKGTALAVLAAILNSLLVWFLFRIARQENSIIIRANAVHIMSDIVTTAVAIGGAGLAYLTHLIWIDILVAFMGGVYISHEGWQLVRESMTGLMDEATPEVNQKLRELLNRECREHNWSYHALRHRTEGDLIWVELHLVFNETISLKQAHDEASYLEAIVQQEFNEDIEIITHLEPNNELRQKLREND